MTPTRIEDFPLAWRWTQESHARLPEDVLASLAPIDPAIAAALYERGEAIFRDESAEDLGSCSSTEDERARQWLCRLPVAADSAVTIAWSRDLALSLPWSVVTNYWEHFCYPASDDAFIILPRGQGVVSYEHYEEFRHRSDVA